MIIADSYNGFSSTDFVKNGRIPFMVFDPENRFVTPGINSNYGSQVDFLPTLFDILQMPTEISSFGTSLLQETASERFGLICRTTFCYWLDGKDLLSFSASGNLLDYHRLTADSRVERSDIKISPADKITRFRAYTQAVQGYLLSGN